MKKNKFFIKYFFLCIHRNFFRVRFNITKCDKEYKDIYMKVQARRLFLHPLPGDVHSAPSKPVACCCGLHWLHCAQEKAQAQQRGGHRLNMTRLRIDCSVQDKTHTRKNRRVASSGCESQRARAFESDSYCVIHLFHCKTVNALCGTFSFPFPFRRYIHLQCD